MPQYDDRLAGAELVIKALVDHHLHTDALIWRRVPYLIAIDAAVWSGMYVLANAQQPLKTLAILVGIAGILFTLMLWIIVDGAIQNRDLNMALIDKLLRDYLGRDVYALMVNHANDLHAKKGWLLLFAAPDDHRRGAHKYIKAVTMFRMAFGFSIFIDVILILDICRLCLPRILN